MSDVKPPGLFTHQGGTEPSGGVKIQSVVNVGPPQIAVHEQHGSLFLCEHDRDIDGGSGLTVPRHRTGYQHHLRRCAGRREKERCAYRAIRIGHLTFRLIQTDDVPAFPFTLLP